MDVVRKAYEDGLIIPGAITLKDFERTLDLGLEHSLANVRWELSWRVPEDIERLLALLAICEEVDDDPDAMPRQILHNAEKVKVKRKNKKKMVKASQRKNR